MGDPKIDVKALRALRAKATPGRVFVEDDIFDPEGPARLLDADRALVVAAVNALPALLDLAERADDGLAFGPVTESRFGPIRYAVAADGALYEMDTEPGEPGLTWRMSDDDSEFGVHDTVREAIEAARAHDRKRRGAK